MKKCLLSRVLKNTHHCPHTGSNDAYSTFHDGGDSPEGLVDGSVPAEEGAGSKEDEPENGETKVHTIA